MNSWIKKILFPTGLFRLDECSQALQNYFPITSQKPTLCSPMPSAHPPHRDRWPPRFADHHRGSAKQKTSRTETGFVRHNPGQVHQPRALTALEISVQFLLLYFSITNFKAAVLRVASTHTCISPPDLKVLFLKTLNMAQQGKHLGLCNWPKHIADLFQMQRRKTMCTPATLPAHPSVALMGIRYLKDQRQLHDRNNGRIL